MDRRLPSSLLEQPDREEAEVLKEAEYQSLLRRISHDLFSPPTVQMIDMNGDYQDPDVGWLPAPGYATPGSAAIDLRWDGNVFGDNGFTYRVTPEGQIHDGELQGSLPSTLSLPPGVRVKLGTGLKIHCEDSSVTSLVLPRSGLGSKGLVISNLVGLIDPDYQGEWVITLWNASNEVQEIKPGDRLVQAVFLGLGGIVRPNFEFVDRFESDTERGEGGFGSTGE